MTKPFSALAAGEIAGLAMPAQADTFDSYLTHSFPRELIGRSADLPADRPLLTAPLPDWILDRVDADADYIALLHWASTRPETWGSESRPYRIAVPGPSYVGVIPAPIPEGWVVTNRCLAWDDYYANAERPHGDCYIFEMRPLAIGPFATD
ncbi:hypothetical protein HKCCE4037_14615 [Rhodobacterales bacterium HKCCE4037]|nr:hypothetical protein [Rhodobacterales bacterium HKCCE4037]